LLENRGSRREAALSAAILLFGLLPAAITPPRCALVLVLHDHRDHGGHLHVAAIPEVRRFEEVVRLGPADSEHDSGLTVPPHGIRIQLIPMVASVRPSGRADRTVTVDSSAIPYPDKVDPDLILPPAGGPELQRFLLGTLIHGPPADVLHRKHVLLI
jgi:hypothetical protein